MIEIISNFTANKNLLLLFLELTHFTIISTIKHGENRIAKTSNKTNPTITITQGKQLNRTITLIQND